MKRILMTGQSTAGGIGSGGGDFSEINSRVTVWNCSSSIAGSVGNAYVSPVRGQNPFRSGDNNNPGIWFCDAFADHFVEDVEYTLIYKDGEAITNWLASGEMDTRMASVFAAQSSVPWDIVLWQQGDAEGFSGQHNSYSGWFGTMQALWISRGWIRTDTPIMVGSLGASSTYDNMNTVLAALPSLHENVFFTNFEDLTTSDGTHFTGPSMNTMGERHFTNYLTNVYIPPPSHLNALMRYIGNATLNQFC